jgi:hypothetical protein
MTTLLGMMVPRTAAAVDTGTPDSDQVKANSSSGFLALQVVTGAAQAVANTQLEPIPAVQSDDPEIQKQMKDVNDKFADIQTKLDTAKVTAKLWLPGSTTLNSGLCADFSSLIPNHILSFRAAYSAASDEILSLLEEAKKEGNSKVLIGEALDLIQYLQAQVTKYQGEMTDASHQLNDFTAKVQADHDALVGGADAIQTLIGIDNTDADNLKNDIARLQDEIKAYQKQLTEAAIGMAGGIFVAVIGVALCFTPAAGVGGVMIAVGVAGLAVGAGFVGSLEQKISHDQSEITSEQATEDALHQQAKALTGLHLTVSGLVDQLTAAQTALSSLATFWTTMQGTLSDVIEALNEPNASLPAVIDEIAVKRAATRWNDLADFAKVLQTAPVTVDFKPAASQTSGPAAAAAVQVRRFVYVPGGRAVEMPAPPKLARRRSA